MKKALLFTGITVLVSLNALAQEKNYRDEYFFITEEYEVGDTLEAKRKAEEQERIDNEQILQLNAYRLNIVHHIDSLLTCKKAKDDKSLQILRDAFVHKMKTYYSNTDEHINHLLYNTSEGKQIRKGDLSDHRICDYLRDYRTFQKETYQKITERKAHYNWKDYLTLHKETRTIKKKNPNYRPGYTEIDAEWQWLQDIYDNGGLNHIVTKFPKEEDYYQSNEYPDYRFYYDDNRHPYAVDKDGKLIGVAIDNRYSSYENEEKMKAATMLYDFEHNIYNIKSESKGVQRWAYYLINQKLGKNTEADFERDAMGMMIGVGSIGYEMEVLRRLLAYRQITKSEYDKKMSQLNAKAKALNKKNNAVSKKYPSNAEMDRAQKFVEQLESDYYNAKLFSSVSVKRLNGIQVLYETDNGKLKVLKTFLINSKGELKANYVTIEKAN